jgi:Zn-dependent peptidase ImmA (M78 family)
LKILNDPFKKIIKRVNKKYPELKANIYFTDEILLVDGDKCYAYTCFYPDGRDPDIFIWTKSKFCNVIDSLMHELAHIIVGPDIARAHGKEWKEIYNWVKMSK